MDVLYGMGENQYQGSQSCVSRALWNSFRCYMKALSLPSQKKKNKLIIKKVIIIVPHIHNSLNFCSNRLCIISKYIHKCIQQSISHWLKWNYSFVGILFVPDKDQGCIYGCEWLE